MLCCKMCNQFNSNHKARSLKQETRTKGHQINLIIFMRPQNDVFLNKVRTACRSSVLQELTVTVTDFLKKKKKNEQTNLEKKYNIHVSFE